MKAIDILVKEHDEIIKIIEITKVILNHDDNTSIDMDHVNKIIGFIENFADKYHHLKEEDVLFVEMLNYGMSKDNGPIAMMLFEHDKGRQFIKEAKNGIEKLKSGDNQAFDQIKNNLLAYCQLLTNHIGKENNILYPMAEQILPSDIALSMSENFTKMNASTVENEYYDKYIKLVNELSAIYLK